LSAAWLVGWLNDWLNDWLIGRKGHLEKKTVHVFSVEFGFLHFVFPNSFQGGLTPWYLYDM